ncbi:MAG: 6-carboxytetrahydropterin synthase QueD [Spirochaetota bacterium]
MYILTVEDSFAAAHQLHGYMGKCENLHGHNWKIELEVAGHVLNDIGLLIDFHDLKDILKSVLADLDHGNLNETELFSKINPSSENIAHHISTAVQKRISEGNFGENIHVRAVTVWESGTSRCTYIPE